MIQKLILMLFIALPAHAEFYVYYSHQAETNIRETGQAKADAYNKEYLLYEDDFDRNFSGVALEYRMKLTPEFSLGPAFLYQNTTHVQQRTTTYGSSVNCDTIDDNFCVEGASRDDMVHITYHHLYVNAYYHVNESFSLFAAPIFTMPDVNNHGRFQKYRIENGIGFHGGIDIKLTEKIAFQALWRNMTLDTYDTNIDYDGDRVLDTFMFNIGYRLF